MKEEEERGSERDRERELERNGETNSPCLLDFRLIYHQTVIHRNRIAKGEKNVPYLLDIA